jgi:hypothetical protein
MDRRVSFRISITLLCLAVGHVGGSQATSSEGEWRSLRDPTGGAMEVRFQGVKTDRYPPRDERLASLRGVHYHRCRADRSQAEARF